MSDSNPFNAAPDSTEMPAAHSAPAVDALVATQVSKSFRRRKVVQQVSLTINKGQVVGLLGPNGAGKTTTFYMLAGLLKPDSGSITFNAQEITNIPLHKRVAMGLGYLAQERSVFRNMTVEDNLLAVLEHGLLKGEALRRKAAECLEMMKLSHLRKAMGYHLSGGEARRVEIARVLALDPQFILMDEPFAGVDPIAVMDIQSLIRDIQAQGIGICITDHNVRETLTATDWVYIIHQGSVLVEGFPKDLVENDLVREIYLGSYFKL